MRQRALKAAFPHTLPVMAGYLVLGIGFGVLMSAQGLSPWYAGLMSLMIFAGSMQYAGVALLAAAAPLAHIALMTLLINARHLFYGLSMLEKLKDVGKKRPYIIFGLTDETYSLLCTLPVPPGVNQGWFYFFITGLNHLYWIAGGLLGALAGRSVSFDFAGIEFSMTALFIVIFTDQWLRSRDRRPAIIGVGATALSLLLFGQENMILPAMALMMLLLMLFRPALAISEADL